MEENKNEINTDNLKNESFDDANFEPAADSALEIAQEAVLEPIQEEAQNYSKNYDKTISNEELISVRPVKFQEFEQKPPKRSIKKNLDIMQDISMHVSVELGRTKSSIREVMDLEEGAIVELNKIAGEQVEIFVNEKFVAKGEVIVIEDKFGVRVTSTNISKVDV